MAESPDDLPADTPAAVRTYAQTGSRTPTFDPTLGRSVARPARRGRPKHRVVALGDSLTHGFQSGAIYLTDLSYPAIIAHELGWSGFRRPEYGGRGGLPLNIEYLLRELEHRFGPDISFWETPLALFQLRNLMDEIEDYWERGAGGSPPPATHQFMHALAVYGWDLRDALDRTAANCAALIGTPVDNVLDQFIEHHGERAALRVLPGWAEAAHMTVFDVAAALGNDHDTDTDAGIETLIVLLGANNALRTVTDLRLNWSGSGFASVAGKAEYTMWNPAHFTAELNQVVDRVRNIRARHVIWGTVPHVTIPPVSRGVGRKTWPGSRYFPYYARPWISDNDFDPQRHPHLTGAQARAIDYGIDMFNDSITAVVDRARTSGLDWYLFDLSALLDRLAARRYIDDPNARPAWWTPYPLPAALANLNPVPDSRFLTGDQHGGRATGGLFSLDGVHPSTVGYGLIAQEIITIMRRAEVDFHTPDGTPRLDPVTVDFGRLNQRDTLLNRPPQNVGSTLETLGWADNTVSVFKHALQL